MYRKRRAKGDYYDSSDHDFINAVRACLGLAPLTSRGKPSRKNYVKGLPPDYQAMIPVSDGNRHVRAYKLH